MPEGRRLAIRVTLTALSLIATGAPTKEPEPIAFTVTTPSPRPRPRMPDGQAGPHMCVTPALTSYHGDRLLPFCQTLAERIAYGKCYSPIETVWPHPRAASL